MSSKDPMNSVSGPGGDGGIRPLTLEALNACLAHRHSCRAFSSRPVRREVITRILSTAQRTASWCNAQPWRVSIVSGPMLERLRSTLLSRSEHGVPPSPELEWPREYRGVYQERRRECGWQLYRAVGIEKGDREGSAKQARENFRLFGAPHLAVVTSDEALGVHGVMDCGAWVSNFMLAATAAGVSTIAQASLAAYPDVLREFCDVAAGPRQIVCGISFGYEDSQHPANGFRTDRASLDEVVAWVD